MKSWTSQGRNFRGIRCSESFRRRSVISISRDKACLRWIFSRFQSSTTSRTGKVYLLGFWKLFKSCKTVLNLGNWVTRSRNFKSWRRRTKKWIRFGRVWECWVLPWSGAWLWKRILSTFWRNWNEQIRYEFFILFILDN